jgi:hypothetical protein
MEADVSPELESMPVERLEEEIGELAAHIHAATCRWLLLVAEFDRREGWLEWGAKSCGQWLSWRCGVAPRAAREQVRVARRLAELPLVREAFERGELSYSKVRALSRVASPKSEPELVPLAIELTAAQLERLVRRYRGVVSTQVEQANAVRAERDLEWEWDDDGSLLLRGRLPAEDGALLVKALEAGRDRLRERGAGEGGSAEPQIAASDLVGVGDEPAEQGPRSPASNADALVSVAETLLADGPARRPAGERYQVVVHVDQGTLRDDDPDGCCEVEDGPALPAETARRLGCDASLVAIVERDGRPLSVGRKRRTVPAALRRALQSRDRGCRFPGCGERRFVDAHHVRHWAQGGETKLSNLLLLCRHHHRLLHEGGYQLERRPGGGGRFRGPDGRLIPAVPRNRPGDRRRLVEHGSDAGFRITQETPAARSACERLDYDIAVEGLLAAEGWLDVGLVNSGRRGKPGDDFGSRDPGGSAEPQPARAELLT